MANPFVHVELMSTDVDKAKAFYSQMFDWELKDMDMGDMTYTTINVGHGTGGGLMKNPIPNTPSMWMPYILVDNLEESDSESEVSRRAGHEGDAGSAWHGMVQHHHRSRRRHDRSLAAEGHVSPFRRAFLLRSHIHCARLPIGAGGTSAAAGRFAERLPMPDPATETA